MTIELEQEFFKTFGIEPKYTYIGHYPLTDENGIIQPPEYPEITDRKLLEMMCIYNNNVYENEKITPSNINTLKEDVLHWIINDFEGNEKIKKQIQQLFEEEK